MDFSQVQATLNDLPPTFKRPGAPYTQFVDAETSELYRGTAGSDGLIQQVLNINNARYGWLDIWGLLFSWARVNNAADSIYLQQLLYVILAGGGPPAAMSNWIKAVWGIDVTVTDTAADGGVGYTLTFPAGVTLPTIHLILDSLARVRPAGVPILELLQPTDGGFLRSISFFGGVRTGGAFIPGTLTDLGVDVLAVTNNFAPGLPGLLISDPTLNPPS